MKEEMDVSEAKLSNRTHSVGVDVYTKSSGISGKASYGFMCTHLETQDPSIADQEQGAKGRGHSCHSSFRSSTSKTRVACGGIMPGCPVAP